MSAHPALKPGSLGGLELRNRIIKTATYEGMSPGGLVEDALVQHHTELARGGVGMTTVAYCAVSPDGRTFAEQLLMCEENLAAFKALTTSVHTAGAAVSLQLGHCGGFSKNKELVGKRPYGPSTHINEYGLFSGLIRTRAMTAADMERTTEEFATAALNAKDSGFDAVEVHLGHGYLLSQFLSPKINRRRDRYGGSLENRMRFPLQVVRRVRERVGPDFPVIAKTNLDDGVRGGLTIDEAIEVARALENSGVTALVMSGGLVTKSALYLMRGERPLKEMIEVEKNPAQRLALRIFGPSVIKKVEFEELFFLPLARQIRAAVSMPLILLGGAISGENLATAMNEGFEFVAMGRALLADPDFVNRLAENPVFRTRCNQCNKCIAEMDRGGVRCVL